MDRDERLRLVRVALEVVVGDRAGLLEVEEQGEFVLIHGAGETGGFGVWTSDGAQGDDPPPFLEHAIEVLTDELTESSPFWGMRLPLCPAHPDEHPLVVEVSAHAVRGVCPASGVVREVTR